MVYGTRLSFTTTATTSSSSSSTKKTDFTSDDTTKKSSNTGASGEDNKKDDSMFECNIWLETAKDAVVGMCGHLFCWPCLLQWLETRPTRELCPFCKAEISKEKVIPLYERGSTKQEDPRNKVPPRPAGQRTEPEQKQGFQGSGFGDGSFNMCFGIGAFPFGYFASSFNFGDPRPPVSTRGTTQYQDEQQLTKIPSSSIIMYWLTCICIASQNKVPPRPAGQRTEPEQKQGFQGFGFGDGGFHMSFSIRAFLLTGP